MQEINGKTRVCGLIGYPVEHTLSPLIHNMLAERQTENLVYVPLPVKNSETLESVVKGARAMDFLGMNVTVPYKSAVIPYLSGTDSLAEQIGAVNTLVSCPDGYYGYNTDMSGLKRALESEKIQMEKQTVILLGAGGAARAVAFLCANSGVKKVYLLNRTRQKAEEVACEVNQASGRNCVMPMALDEFQKIEENDCLAIQGTSVGLFPDTESAVITDKAFYQKVSAGFDLIYRPFETRFMKLVRENGKEAYNGLKMLLYQGIEAYELWTGQKVSEKMAEEIYTALKKELGI